MKKEIFKLASEAADGMAEEKVRQILLMAHFLNNNISSIKVEPWVFEHITTAHDDLMEVTSYIKQLKSNPKDNSK